MCLLQDKKNYNFSYTVLDDAEGDDYSHTQFRNAHATNGEYRVKLPDGRLQIVSYKADKNGYNANVQYEEIISPEKYYYQDHTPIYEENSEQEAANNLQRNAELEAGNKFRIVPPQKVELFSDIHGGQEVREFIRPVLNLYVVDSGRKGPRRNVATVPIRSPDGYSRVYINTPKFSLVQQHSHNNVHG